MSGKVRIAIVCAGAAAAAALAFVLSARLERTNEVNVLTGAVLTRAADPRQQRPIPDAQITVAGGLGAGVFSSDASGRFSVHLRSGIRSGDVVTLRFRHPHYEPLDVAETAGGEIYIVRMRPVRQINRRVAEKPPVSVSDVRIRYAAKVTTTANVGSLVKTFEVANTGNVPCKRGSTCSPDGRWSASVGGTSVDAGAGHTFRNVRVSCIAGPCPFTKIVNDNFSQGGRTISVSVLNWSDTTTFLVEAEVVRTMPSETVRWLYPVIFGRSMNFTLPPSAEGPSIEADINGEQIVFPLGPKLILSWADCRLEVARDFTKMYRCDLKDGFDFR